MALILIIDDEWDLRSAIATGLARAGYDVAEAEDGDQGLAEIGRLRPDVVLCDISMPGLSGEDVLRRVRADLPDLARMPFLFLTALSDHDSMVAGRRLGADDYLTKPVDLELLVATVDQRLAQARRWDQTFVDERQRERAEMLSALSERSRLSLVSSADVLNHLSDGVLLLNRAGMVIFVNRIARRILLTDDGLMLRQGRLAADRAQDGARLRLLLAAVLDGDARATSRHVGVKRPSLRAPYLLRGCRLEAGLDLDPDYGAIAAIFICDPEMPRRPSGAAMMTLFDFTQAEARIAVDLAVGLSVDEIASGMKISRNTVHHHLRSLFRKTDTARQVELVARLLAAAGSLDPAAPSPG